MPLKVIAAADALNSVASNAAARWPSRGQPGNRIEPLARPSFQAGFSLKPDASVFTIGSCFARNIESALMAHGLDVLVRRAWSHDVTRRSSDHRIIDIYSVASIWNELAWAAGAGPPFDAALHLVELYPDRCADLHLHWRVPLSSRAEAMARRERIATITRSAFNADVIIMTLGLAEVWWDKDAGVHLNTKPHDALLLAYPERFEIHVLDYNEVFQYLQRSMDLLLSRGKENVRVILTVSPVPLTATFTDADVSVANQYSKSVLRAATEAIVARYSEVQYFPSYESVVLSERTIAWQGDMVHVQPALVDDIVRRMVSAYLPESQEVSLTPIIVSSPIAGEREVLDEASRLARQRLYVQAADLLTQFLDELGEQRMMVPRTLRMLGRMRMILGEHGEAEHLFREVLAVSWNDSGTHDYLGRVLTSLGRDDEALQSFDTALSFNPLSPLTIAHLAGALRRAGREDEARAVLDRGLSLHPDHPVLARAAAA